MSDHNLYYCTLQSVLQRQDKGLQVIKFCETEKVFGKLSENVYQFLKKGKKILWTLLYQVA